MILFNFGTRQQKPMCTCMTLTGLDSVASRDSDTCRTLCFRTEQYAARHPSPVACQHAAQARGGASCPEIFHKQCVATWSQAHVSGYCRAHSSSPAFQCPSLDCWCHIWIYPGWLCFCPCSWQKETSEHLSGHFKSFTQRKDFLAKTLCPGNDCQASHRFFHHHRYPQWSLDTLWVIRQSFSMTRR